MSNVTNVILTFSVLENEKDRISELNNFKVNNNRFTIVSIDDKDLPRGWYGGSKMFEANLYIGAYNYFDKKAFLRYLKDSINWNEPECVQIFIKEEGDDIFTVYSL